MSFGQNVSDAIVALAEQHPEVELNVKDYANLRHFAPKSEESKFEVVPFSDSRFAEGQHAVIGSCRILVRADVPELHARIGKKLIRLPYPEDF